ncbi:hypothetical protein N7452_010943 [Penicillium brevicompactum]|uniref:Uncharacterized protein n=1 Tax=Penicillium brevicompactum TaxID=5074 RepID=A0A9W9U8L2_PENBR|nr:hypothetical protein N7452_010943 [Penicillium brevicompactum]
MSTHAFLTETDGLPSDWSTIYSECSYNHQDLRPSLMSRSLSVLYMPDTMATFMPTETLSTGAPKMAAGWWTCCSCKQMVNPNLAPESRCPCCSHTRCGTCRSENVQ